MGGDNKQVADAVVAIDIQAGVVVRTWVVDRAGVCLVVRTM